MSASLRFKQRVKMMQHVIRAFLRRVHNAKTHNSLLWDRVSIANAKHATVVPSLAVIC